MKSVILMALCMVYCTAFISQVLAEPIGIGPDATKAIEREGGEIIEKTVEVVHDLWNGRSIREELFEIFTGEAKDKALESLDDYADSFSRKERLLPDYKFPASVNSEVRHAFLLSLQDAADKNVRKYVRCDKKQFDCTCKIAKDFYDMTRKDILVELPKNGFDIYKLARLVYSLGGLTPPQIEERIASRVAFFFVGEMIKEVKRLKGGRIEMVCPQQGFDDVTIKRMVYTAIQEEFGADSVGLKLKRHIRG